MRSIRARIILIITVAIVLSTGISTALGILDVVKIGQSSSEQALKLLCENGEKNLDYYFDSVGQSVKMVASYVEADLEEDNADDLKEHVERVNVFFGKIARQTNGVLTYYYRIDPSFSDEEDGFWYVDSNGNGFTEHEVTDITLYDTNDTSQLVWYTIPKASREPVWIPPYITDNLDVRVISYNVPVFLRGKFVGVIGIEIDYITMANQVDNIKLYDYGYAFINDQAGRIIYHPGIDVLALSKDEIPQTPDELKEYAKFIRYRFDGIEKEAYRLPLQNGMILNVSVPVSEINRAWRNLIIRTILVSLGLLIVFVLLAWRLAEHIIKPLSKLAEAAKRVSDGDYEVELEYRAKDEVGVLTISFKSLIEHLKIYINDLNQLNQRLQQENLTLEAATIQDSLTGVKNRFALRRDYDTFYEKNLHLMILDIDNFKRVNDQYGHSVGDYLLKKTGEALLDNFGGEHSYRYGGDEFMVIYPDITEEEFKTLLFRMEEQLEEVYINEKKLAVHFSAGYVYGKSELREDLRQMLKDADQLLYKAKQTGKNTFLGEPFIRKTEIDVDQA